MNTYTLIIHRLLEIVHKKEENENNKKEHHWSLDTHRVSANTRAKEKMSLRDILATQPLKYVNNMTIGVTVSIFAKIFWKK